MITYPNTFISGTKEYNTFEKPVPAPMFRKTFVSDVETIGTVTIAACGFYELYVNGTDYTKGFLAPYISNPEHYIYCDSYEVAIKKGKNVIGILLGNGLVNNPGGYIWDFDKASFRSAPMVGLTLTYQDEKGKTIVLESDKSFKTAPSAILSDDYRYGIYYDANCEQEGWQQVDFEDELWINAIEVTPPCGELKICEASPIIVEEEWNPVSIAKVGESFVYDFGVSHAGVCKLTIKGQQGQKIELQHADRLCSDGSVDLLNVWFDNDWERDKEIIHKDTYICSGKETETFVPKFTYHGFRYVQVSGITEEQATEDLLTFVVFHSKLEKRGDFTCSDPVANKLQEITCRSTISNFHYFPTDCPQREKNGWTADAALSCEHTLLNFNPEKDYREWLRNICKAQNEEGALPGIIPTGGWGFAWGNGPAWDCVLVYLPYFTYIYRGETAMIKESAKNILKYLKYLETRMDEQQLLHIGLGDWCYIERKEPKAPLIVTDSIMAMDIAGKAAFLFGVIKEQEGQEYALELVNKIRLSIRTHLVDPDTKIVKGNCQTSQAMGLYYGVFEQEEEQQAFGQLLNFIQDADNHMDVGVLGGRVIFHVLSKFGYSDLAYQMITRPDFPSYGNWVERGATTLWEDFWPDTVSSMNHHFWGNISAWFMRCVAGIQYGPEIEVIPSFIDVLDYAEGYYVSPMGRIASSWKRQNGEILWELEIPKHVHVRAKLDKDYCFEDGTKEKSLKTGKYCVKLV